MTKISKNKIAIILVLETVLLLLFTGIIAHIYNPHTEQVSQTVIERKADSNKENEKIITETDEFVWTTDYADGRKGPGETYEYLTTFNKEAGLRRTGITQNGWSKVVTEEQTYYVENKLLTTKSPYQLDDGDKGILQEYALSQLPKYGWEDSEMDDLITLWNKESGWNPRAENPSSGAYGIPQSLPADKMTTAGDDWKTNGKTQIDWGLQYIKDRYGAPSKALEFHLEHNWY